MDSDRECWDISSLIFLNVASTHRSISHSNPFNLCRSHTLPFSPTSNPYSQLVLSIHSCLSSHKGVIGATRLPSLVVIFPVTAIMLRSWR